VPSVHAEETITMNIRNRAFAFIKPHVINNAKVCEYIAQVWERHGIRVVDQGEISGEQIGEQGLIDKHYAVNATVGTTLDPSQLVLDDDARATFESLFGESWDAACTANRIFSGAAMQERLGGISGDALIERWMENGLEKVGGGLYVSHFKADDCYVLNGFYPSIREVFTAPGSKIGWALLEFDGAALPWSTFRADVIGGTNPAAASAESIRGYLHAHAEEFGIELSYRDNVIHASASPFEALVEQVIWLGLTDMREDPLGASLADAGMGPDQVLDLRDTNPLVTVAGETGKLVDLAEDRNTPAVLELLKAIS
jgi:nucleoside diphosphate kinase